MDKTVMAAIALIVGLVIGVVGVYLVIPPKTVTETETLYSPLSWEEIVAKGKEQGHVSWYAYGDLTMELAFLEVIDEFNKEYPEIEVELVMGGWWDTQEKLVAEKEQNKAVGDIDVTWMWSTPVSRLIKADAHWDVPIIDIIPNRELVPYWLRYQNDMFPTGGRYVPFVQWQNGFVYNKELVTDPPEGFPDLLDWCKANPGKFGYCDPGTGGSGTNFVMTVIYWLTGYDKYAFRSYDVSLTDEWQVAWDYLNELEDYIAPYYSGNLAVAEAFAREEIWLMPMWQDMTYLIIEEGRIDAEKVGMYIPKPTITAGSWDGCLIPFNAPHKEAALVFINFFLTDPAQAIMIEDLRAYPINPKTYDEETPMEIKTQPWRAIRPDVWTLEEFINQAWIKHAEFIEPMLPLWTEKVAAE